LGLSACFSSTPTTTTAPGAKDTCEEIVATVLPADIELIDRNLVPYSPTLLGVEAEYESESANVVIVSGGYLDDQLEAYDDLLPVGDIQTIGDRRAEYLSGVFGNRSVQAAIWDEPSLQVPCSTRAVIAVGITQDEFVTLLAGLGTRQPPQRSGE
jgi:hypothetical protein